MAALANSYTWVLFWQMAVRKRCIWRRHDMNNDTELKAWSGNRGARGLWHGISVGERWRVSGKACWGKIVNLVKGYGPFPSSMKGLLKVSKRKDEMFRALKIIFIYMKQFWRKIPEENVTQCKGTEKLTSVCKGGSLLSVQLCPISLKTHMLLSCTSPLANVTVLLCRRAFRTAPPSLDCTRN